MLIVKIMATAAVIVAAVFVYSLCVMASKADKRIEEYEAADRGDGLD